MESESPKLLPAFGKSLGMAILIFLIANLLGFLYQLFQDDSTGDKSIAFKWGSFYLNGETSGPMLGSSTATFLLFATFCFFLYRNIEKQRTNPNA